MRPRSDRGSRLLAACLCACLSAPAFADGLGVGQPLPSIDFVDQFDASHALDGCDWLLFAPDRTGSDIARDVLSDPGLAGAPGQGLCHVADISTMPAVITRLFAIPAMRDYPYPVLLDREGALTAGWPRQPGHLSVLDVRDGRVASLGFAASVDDARGLLPVPEP
jgi:hypothetical protein